MVVIRRTAICLLCFLLYPAITSAQEGNVIRGKVRSKDGHVVSGASVDLQTGTGSTIGQTVTNNEGDFVFGGLPETSYQVVVSALGYDAAQERVEFSSKAGADRPGETHVLFVTMVPETRKSGGRITGTAFVQTVPPDARKAMDKSLKLLAEGKAEPAVAALREAIRVFPEYFEAHLILGGELLKESKIADSIFELEHARQVNPRDPRVYQLFGLALMKQQKFEIAAQVFTEAAKLAPTDPQPEILRAVALIDQVYTLDRKDSAATTRRIAEAEGALKRAQKLGGERVHADHQSLAKLYELKKDLKRAVAELDAYMRESPTANDVEQVRKWKDRIEKQMLEVRG
jgi:tetratricopeptide (TPR) repeat protein